MRRQSIPAVVAVSFLLLITATPIPVFGITLYLDDGGQHIFDDDSHKWDEVYLVQNIYHDPGTRLEISTDGWVKNLSAYNNSEVTFNGGSSVDKVSAFGRSTVTINTGHIGGDLLTEASITVHLKGGSVGGDLWAYGSGKLYNYVSDFGSFHY